MDHLLIGGLLRPKVQSVLRKVGVMLKVVNLLVQVVECQVYATYQN